MSDNQTPPIDLEKLRTNVAIHVGKSQDDPTVEAIMQTFISFLQQPQPSNVNTKNDSVNSMESEQQEHPESYCHRCDGRNVSWTAPSPLWNEVMRGGDINGEWQWKEIICMNCFAELAVAKGINLFRLYATDVKPELKTVTPNGRVWNDKTWLWEQPVGPVGDVKFITVLKDLGFIYSEENEAWMHSEYGMGFTSQIAVAVLKRISDKFAAQQQSHQKALERQNIESRTDELNKFEPLMQNHDKCIDPRSCVGYQNAVSDFDNEKQIRLDELQQKGQTHANE